MNAKQKKQEVVNQETIETKVSPMSKMTAEEKDTKCQELREMSNRIRTQYQKLRQQEAVINSQTYEIGRDLRSILQGKLFKLLQDEEGKEYTFKTYCQKELTFSDKYAYMLINATKVQDALENDRLTEVKQGHHQLRKLSKYIDDLDTLKKIWQKASKEDLKAVPNIADIVTAIEEVESATENKGSDDPVETAYKNILKWGGLKQLNHEQKQQLIERLKAYIGSLETEDDDRDND